MHHRETLPLRYIQVLIVAAAVASGCSGRDSARSALELNIEVIVSLGADPIPGPPVDLVVDGRGRTWATFGQGPPLTFDSAGRLLKVVGSEGQGPGEFKAAAGLLAVPGDSVVVLDIALARATVIGPDLEPARTISLPGTMVRARTLAWPRIVAVGLLEGTNHGFHLLDLSSDRATVGASFGPGNPVPSHPPPFFLGSVAVDARDRIYTSDGYRYVVQEWAADGKRVAESRRQPDWFTGSSDWLSISRDRPPEPLIVGIYVDSDGRRLVTAHRAAPRWHEAWPPEQSGATAVNIASLDPARLYETVLEVIGTGEAPQLLATTVLPGHVTAILSDGRLASYEELPNGAPAIHLLRVSTTN